MDSRYTGILAATGLAVVLYLNTIGADFAYDDSRAIQKNQDLLPETPLINLFYDDFWGTPLTHTGSHKSYRPLCVLTFRLNHLISGLEPWSYHLGNVLCHALTTGVFTWGVTHLLGPGIGAVTSGLLFASHPVHTEAVAGVVGRADVLACLLFMLTLAMYVRYVRAREGHGSLASRVVPALGVAVLTAAAMLTKEQALTVLAVCAVYDVIVVHRATLRDILTFRIITQSRFRSSLEGLALLASCGLGLLAFRIQFMGNTPPEFAPSDNPASDSDSWLTRTMTYSYLPLVNAWLLLCPRVLSFDWSMEAIPLVESVGDLRNLATSAFYLGLAYVFIHIVRTLEESSTREAHQVKANGVHTNGHTKSSQQHSPTKNGFSKSSSHSNNNGTSVHSKVPGLTNELTRGCHVSPGVALRQVDLLILAISVIVFPFIPATNLFFYVGFVVAERILYIPSMGVCLLVGVGVGRLARSEKWRTHGLVGVVVVVLAFSAKTVLRNIDWQTEERLYSAGLTVNPAKAWGNLANVFNEKKDLEGAETAYRNALKYRPNMADVHYNLGILLQNQKRFDEAISSYEHAIQFRPKLTVAYLNLGIMMAQSGNIEKAKTIYQRCAVLDTANLKDPKLHDSTKISCLFNLGRLIMDEGNNQEAIEIFKEAVARKPDHYGAQSLFNMMGEGYFKLKDLAEAERCYREALKAKPDHIPAHLTMAKLMQVKGNPKEAIQYLEKAKKINPDDFTVDYHRAQFHASQDELMLAKEIYEKLLPELGDDFEIVYNAANLLRQINENKRAEELYEKAVKLKPSEPAAWMNYGAILHMNGKFKPAEQAYLKGAELDPNNKVNKDNLARLRKAMG